MQTLASARSSESETVFTRPPGMLKLLRNAALGFCLLCWDEALHKYR